MDAALVQQPSRALRDVENKLPLAVCAIGNKGSAGGPVPTAQDAGDGNAIVCQTAQDGFAENVLAHTACNGDRCTLQGRLIGTDGRGAARKGALKLSGRIECLPRLCGDKFDQ